MPAPGIQVHSPIGSDLTDPSKLSQTIREYSPGLRLNLSSSTALLGSQLGQCISHGPFELIHFGSNEVGLVV